MVAGITGFSPHVYDQNKGRHRRPGERSESKFPSDIRRHIFTQRLIDTWRGHLPGKEKHCGHCESKQMPKQGKTTFIFTEHCLFACKSIPLIPSGHIQPLLYFAPCGVPLLTPKHPSPDSIKIRAMLEVKKKQPR